MTINCDCGRKFTPRRFPYHCSCRRVYRATDDKPTPDKVVASGPGTELKRLLAELGLKTSKACGCEAKAAMMNRLGVNGCRERFDEIRAWLVEARGATSWADTLRAAAAAVTSGLVASIDLTDLEGSLLRLAIERAATTSTANPSTPASTNPS